MDRFGRLVDIPGASAKTIPGVEVNFPFVFYEHICFFCAVIWSVLARILGGELKIA